MGTSDRTTGGWIGTAGQVSRLRGVVFKFGCLGATLLALGLMFLFLLYVFNDAIQPMTADSGWLVTFFGMVVVPAIALTIYYYRFDTRAGSVAYTALGLPIAATITAGGVAIVFKHVISPKAWLALVISLAVAAGIIKLHAQARSSNAHVLERLAVVTLVPLLALVGIPAIDVDYTLKTPFLGQEILPIAFSTPQLVPSLRALIRSLPVVPTDGLSLLLALTLPAALGMTLYIRRVRESDRDAGIAGGTMIAIAGIGLVVAPLVGLRPWAWMVLTTVVGIPVGLYVESVLRRGEGVTGLAFPVVIAVGVALAFAVTNTLEFAGPDSWLTWEFLLNSHSRTPRDAGIYPALVGSVMMMLVVAAAAFPLGVGAAIYLEEYAPNKGRLGSIVDLIEINIANLAGVPSVVYGVLGLTVFVRTIGMRSGIVIVGAQESIRAVPDSQRQAAYGMGATKWQTVRTVVLPRAMPGILTGTILAFGRAIGETAPLLMIGAPAVVRIPPGSFLDKFSAMPRQILTWSTEIQTEFRYGVLAAGVLTLLVVLLMMNGTAIVLRNKYQREN